MDRRNSRFANQASVVEFLALEGCRAEEIHKRLEKVYKTDAIFYPEVLHIMSVKLRNRQPFVRPDVGRREEPQMVKIILFSFYAVSGSLTAFLLIFCFLSFCVAVLWELFWICNYLGGCSLIEPPSESLGNSLQTPSGCFGQAPFLLCSLTFMRLLAAGHGT